MKHQQLHIDSPDLPARLQPLLTIARDLRWTWRSELRAVFAALDSGAWERALENPVEFLRIVPPARLLEAAADQGFVAYLDSVAARLSEEDRAVSPHPGAAAMALRGEGIAYFSAEFGLTEALPIYAGGLGVLAGDHLKSASDLAIPLAGVGIFYSEGYFRQLLDGEGRQKESYGPLDADRLPLAIPEPAGGKRPIVSLPLGEREVHLLVRVAQVGRVPLLLLDANLPQNAPADREITSRLYGGDLENRIRQEIVLGIGGMRALDLLGLRPAVRHLNEGHAAFAALEKIRQLVFEEGLKFANALEVAKAGNVFTTHTPVPAGIDRFPEELLEKYFTEYAADVGLPFEDFLALGREVPEDVKEHFSMAVLALRVSGRTNGVSRLHAQVASRLWARVIAEERQPEARLYAITNGVHRGTWTSPEIANLDVLQRPAEVDRNELWRRHEGLRALLVGESRERLASERRRRNAPSEEIEAALASLDPRALTIGFARRFATYKRATLILRDPERLARLLAQPGRPVQILFAGKAHPRDESGKEFLHAISEFAELPEFRGKLVMLPDYDMRLARALVAGCDVWLNNPVRPHEASGTSGMKAGMNGVLNLSVLDGWWDEAPYEEVGFAVGDATDHAPDEEVASALYDILETRVVPLFYDRDEQGVPLQWVERMVASASRIGRLFSSDRMVAEYLEQCYLPAIERAHAIREGPLRVPTLAGAKAIPPDVRLRE